MPKKINLLTTSNIYNSNFANNLSNDSSVVSLKNDLSNKTAQINELQRKYDNLIDNLIVTGVEGDTSLIDISAQLLDLKFSA